MKNNVVVEIDEGTNPDLIQIGGGNSTNETGTIYANEYEEQILKKDEGNELYKFVKEGLSYFVNGYNTVSSLKNLNSGVLKIGASTSVTEHFLMPYLKEFHKL